MSDLILSHDKPKRSWIAIGFVLMALYLAALGGGTVYGFLQDSKDDRRIEAIVSVNRRNSQIALAFNCVQSHERTVQIRKAINITPESIVEVSEDNSDSSQKADIDAFLAAIKRRVDEQISTPTCDLDGSRRKLVELESKQP